MDCSQPDMPLSDFTKVLDEVATFVNPSRVLIITTGGEPLVRQDIEDCGREITRRGFLWGMVSNGMSLNSKRLSSLINAGLKTIAISLDGFEEDHNWMRGNRLSFDNAVSAIKALTESKIAWDVITCINNRNINYLPLFRDFLLNLGVTQWRIFTIFPQGRAKENQEFELSAYQVKYLMEFIRTTRLEHKIKLNYSCEGFLGDYENEVRDYQYFCQAGINVASILSDGSISGCLSIRADYNQGNIYSDSFKNVWNNRFTEYRDRKWMKNGLCANCKFWRYCEGNGMHLRESDHSLISCLTKKLQ